MRKYINEKENNWELYSYFNKKSRQTISDSFPVLRKGVGKKGVVLK